MSEIDRLTYMAGQALQGLLSSQCTPYEDVPVAAATMAQEVLKQLAPSEPEKFPLAVAQRVTVGQLPTPQKECLPNGNSADSEMELPATLDRETLRYCLKLAEDQVVFCHKFSSLVGDGARRVANSIRSELEKATACSELGSNPQGNKEVFRFLATLALRRCLAVVASQIAVQASGRSADLEKIKNKLLTELESLRELEALRAKAAARGQSEEASSQPQRIGHPVSRRLEWWEAC